MQLYDMQGAAILRDYARALDVSDDYRVLRRLPRREELWLMPMPEVGADITLGVIDTETTGLGDNAKIIEIALLKLKLVDGQLADITEPLVMLEDPGERLSADIRRITGLSDDDLRGQKFNEVLLAHALGEVDVLCAFNSRFDASHLRRRFQGMRHPWIDARTEYDWATAGVEGRSQQALLTSMGHFYQAHRAASDIWALAMLISMAAPDGRTIAAHLVEAGQRTDMRVAAVGAPFAVKDQLKARGYRWQPEARVWSIDVQSYAIDAERDALQALCPLIRPSMMEIDWFNRHSS